MGNAKSKPSSNKRLSVNAELEFFQFLKQYDNYSAFCGYLEQRQGMENILFLQKVSAVCQIILKYKTLYMASCTNDTLCNGNDCVTEIIHLKHIREIYGEYDSQIRTLAQFYKNRDNVYDIQNFKSAFTAVYKQIYDEFIGEGCANEINISYETKKKVRNILCSDSCNSFDDYLHLFDDTNCEIYQLLTSAYDYQFRQYLSTHFSQ